MTGLNRAFLSVDIGQDPAAGIQNTTGYSFNQYQN